jgi:glycolate oxidase FAD binding subunit
MNDDLTDALREQVKDAAARGRALNIVGFGTKAFLGRTPRGEPLVVAGHRGILSYAPTELVITARAGTPLAEIDAALADHGQLLAFEPPHFGEGATLGGTIACGLSGPRRPYAGAARDFVLGVKVINGRGEVLTFGGEVMKNVAGYDVSRLMTGAFGTLGVLLEVSLKVLPRPAREMTLVHERSADQALAAMTSWAGKPLPLSAACYDGHRLYVRLSGAESAVSSARTRIGGDELAEGAVFWERLREHHHAFFATGRPLWRLSLPPAAPLLALPGKWLLDWGGAQRWLCSEADPQTVRQAAESAGGHASLFRGGDRESTVFHPLAPPLRALHGRLKHAFDPQGILNPGRMYYDL